MSSEAWVLGTEICAHKDYITKVTVLGIAEEQLGGLSWHQRATKDDRKLRYNVGSLSTASCAAERGCNQQLLLLYCFSDILLMQQSWGQSKSHSKNMLCWSRFADASGGKKGSLKHLPVPVKALIVILYQK